MTLLLDSAWSYSYLEALGVGRAIEEKGLLLVRGSAPGGRPPRVRGLKQHIRIPILATETTLGGLYALPQWISYGLATPMEIDADGFVHAPAEPGLGFGLGPDRLSEGR